MYVIVVRKYFLDIILIYVIILYYYRLTNYTQRKCQLSWKIGRHISFYTIRRYVYPRRYFYLYNYIIAVIAHYMPPLSHKYMARNITLFQ